MLLTFIVTFFLSTSVAPEDIDMIILTAEKSNVQSKSIFERSVDGWYLFVDVDPEDKEKKAILVINLRGDFMLMSESNDSDRIMPYLETLDNTYCNECYIHGAKTCSVHGEIPGRWIDINMLLEKPDNGLPDTGTLRIFDASSALPLSVKYNPTEDKNGLSLIFSVGGVAMRWFVHWHTAEKPTPRDRTGE